MHIVIVGNGAAGATAAREIRRRDARARITLVSGESAVPFSRPALMYLYMGHLRPQDTWTHPPRFWDDHRIERVTAWVAAIDLPNRRLLWDGGGLAWDRLLLATGSVPNRFGWPGQDLRRVGGLVSLQDLAALEAWTPSIRRGVIVGGGLIGVELAEMLHSRGKAVTMLVREPGYWRTVLPQPESDLVGAVIRRAGIDLRLGAELETIEDDGRGGVGAVRCGERLDAEFVGLTAGVRPQIALAGAIESARGFLVDDRLRTSAEDVYAAGDCAQFRGPDGPGRVEAVWYTARAQGEVAAVNLLGGDATYRPGTWFNSAKFFDLEYQVYGAIRPDGGDPSVFWSDGQRAIRIAHVDGRVVGFNLLGVRFRHAVCARWIEQGADLDHVLRHLGDAAFDPELGPRYEAAVRAAGGQGWS